MALEKITLNVPALKKSAAYKKAVKAGVKPKVIVGEMREFCTALKTSTEAEAKAKRTNMETARLAAGLKERYGFSGKELAALVNYSEGRLSQLVSSWEECGTSPVIERATVAQCLAAKKVADLTGQKAADILTRGVEQKQSHRQMMVSAQTQKRAEKTAAATEAAARIIAENPKLLESCRNVDCLKWLAEMPPEFVKHVFFDPPYFGLLRMLLGTYKSGRAAGRGSVTEHDTVGRDAAVKLYVDFVRNVRRILLPGGSVSMFLSATAIPNDYDGYMEVMRAIKEGGLRVALAPWLWAKGLTPARNFERPSSSETEHIYILSREEDELVDCWPFNKKDNPPPSCFAGLNPRSDIVRIGSCLKGLSALKADKRTHDFEKPIELGMYIAHKLTYEGEIIWDACGCHGNLTLGAIRAGRRYLYSESNANNYAEGLRRIEAEIRQRAGESAA